MKKKDLTTAELDELIEEATADAYDESEQTVGFYTMIEEHLTLPFRTVVLGVEVVVEEVEMTEDDRLAAVCVRDRFRQRISLLELPLPDPPPRGFEWIEACRRWARRR